MERHRLKTVFATTEWLRRKRFRSVNKNFSFAQCLDLICPFSQFLGEEVGDEG
ncbi:hypothetical protein Cabys_1388 [Caldithrix abyssi DSM 13497]|uniref:Uncharacterized protein n=1 Tax=Caldithrix abyssi DSM 13497 TaxID=880073 RepID=A0A1J1C768_CALAY|nr:hypothetical protein Cabys_1388 [Caldithrix abyssi DSM 13497]